MAIRIEETLMLDTLTRRCAVPLLTVACAVVAIASEASAQGTASVIVIGEEEPAPREVKRGVAPTGMEFSRRALTLGVEFGPYLFDDDDFETWLGNEMYIGLRYSHELGLNTSFSAMVGYFSADNEHPNGDSIEFIPLRAQLELGTFIAGTLSRWYVAGGIGYNFTDALPSAGKESDWPLVGVYLDSEWVGSFSVGIDLRNESRFTSRLELGYLFFTEGDFLMSTGAVTFGYEF